MFKYILKRVLYFIPTLFVITLLTFVLSQLAPGDPVERMLQGGQQDNSSGLSELQHNEDAYLSQARKMGLDKPVFYFSITSSIYPDTLYRIYRKNEREVLSRLIDRYGDWDKIQVYYHNLYEFRRQSINIPTDSTNYNKKRRISESLGALFRSHLEVDVKRLLLDIELAVDSMVVIQLDSGVTKEVNTLESLKAPFSALASSYDEVIAETPGWKKYIPSVHWYGTNNQYHRWLFGEANWWQRTDNKIAIDERATVESIPAHESAIEVSGYYRLRVSGKSAKPEPKNSTSGIVVVDDITPKTNTVNHALSMGLDLIITDSSFVLDIADTTKFALAEDSSVIWNEDSLRNVLETHYEDGMAAAIGKRDVEVKEKIEAGRIDSIYGSKDYNIIVTGGEKKQTLFIETDSVADRTFNHEEILRFEEGQNIVLQFDKDQFKFKGDNSLVYHLELDYLYDYDPAKTTEGFFRWDFGHSYKDKRPVASTIGDAILLTIKLNFISVFLAYLISIPIGVRSAVKKDSAFDRVSTVVLFILYSLPSFWIATILMAFFTTPEYGMDFFPTYGTGGELGEDASWWENLRDHAHHMILPIFCLTYGSFAFISRQMRGGMIGVINQDYIRTAKAKGLSKAVIIWKHAFRNSLIPIITMFAGLLPLMVSGSVIIEVIFQLPGMGKVSFDAVTARNFPVLYTVLMFSAILTMTGILLSDLLYALVDPRISFTKKRG